MPSRNFGTTSKFKKAEYGKKTIENLAADLDVSPSELWACIKFAKKYPEFSTGSREFEKLSWYFIRQNLLFEHKPHIAQATGDSEWFTPSDIIEAAREVMGSIDCDPASCKEANKIVKAKKFFTIEDNGLVQKWNGNVWMNPPYSQPLVADFAEAISAKYEAGEFSQACILVNNATETVWFQRMLLLASAFCFVKGRIKFIDENGEATGAPLQGQIILYFGKNYLKFHEVFGQKGIALNGPQPEQEAMAA